MHGDIFTEAPECGVTSGLESDKQAMSLADKKSQRIIILHC